MRCSSMILYFKKLHFLSGFGWKKKIQCLSFAFLFYSVPCHHKNDERFYHVSSNSKNGTSNFHRLSWGVGKWDKWGRKKPSKLNMLKPSRDANVACYG